MKNNSKRPSNVQLIMFLIIFIYLKNVHLTPIKQNNYISPNFFSYLYLVQFIMCVKKTHTHTHYRKSDTLFVLLRM